MFFQGILATPIPYLVFAILYLLGIMPNAFDSLKEKFEEEFTSEISSEKQTLTSDSEFDYFWIECGYENQDFVISFLDLFRLCNRTNMKTTKLRLTNTILPDKLKFDQINSRPPPNLG